jgi:hypothetical protein
MVEIYRSGLCNKDVFNIDLLAQVHDSILLQVPVERFENLDIFLGVRQALYDAVSPELTYNGRTFKIATDMKMGTNWGGYHKENNPTGMHEIKDHSELVSTLRELGIEGAG